MKLLKPMLLSSFCLIGAISSQTAFSVAEIGISSVEAIDIKDEQAYVCPYPIKLEAKVYNDLQIAGLKKFSYRWILNGDVIDSGRFDVMSSAFGTGYDKQKKIVHVGEDPNQPTTQSTDRFGLKKIMSSIGLASKDESIPTDGWYQFLVLPEGDINWYDAVKSNRASYSVNCKTES